jgi:Domain of unknown function (DUF397)
VKSPKWRKSTHSGQDDGNGGGNCVEVAELGGGLVGVRDSKHPETGQLTFSGTQFARWLAALRTGRP